jgi:hypothetical protein
MATHGLQTGESVIPFCLPHYDVTEIHEFPLQDFTPSSFVCEGWVCACCWGGVTRAWLMYLYKSELAEDDLE